MIFCIDTDDEIQLTQKQLVHLSSTLGDSNERKRFNRNETANFASNKLNILNSGNIRIEKNGKPIVILEAGDVIPHIGHKSNISTVPDGAIEVLSYKFDATGVQLLITQSRLFLQLLASQFNEQAHFQPNMVFYQAGEIMVKQGDEGDVLLTLVEGQAKAEVDGVVVGDIRSGEAFGVVATLTTGKRSATVRATSNCTVMSVPADKLELMIKSNPSLSLNIMKSLANYLLQANQKGICPQGDVKSPVLFPFICLESSPRKAYPQS